MKKKFIFFILIFLIILILILVKVEYKEINLGNNISSNTDIFNISSYEAIAEIEVYSNKNTNKYIVNQKYNKENVFWQEIIEPNNLKGLTITSDGNSVTIENKLLDLKALYENFNGDISNLSLVSFITRFKDMTDKETEENEEEIIMKMKIDGSKNKYQMYQNLYISKDTNLPTKMEILDINKNRTVYILYSEIKVNQTSKNDVLGI